MKKVLHQLFNRNPQLRVLDFHGKEAPFTIKKGNQEKFLAYIGGGMSPPPLGTSKSLKSSLISLKVGNLAPCSTSSFSEVHTQELSVVIILLKKKAFYICANQALKGLKKLDVALSAIFALSTSK